MKSAHKIFRFIFTVEFIGIWVAIFTLSVCLTAFFTMMDPENFGEVFKALFTYSAFSFLISYFVAKLLERLFFSNFPIKFMWFPAVVLGGILFTAFFQSYVPVAGIIFFAGFPLLALVPSATFILTTNFVISYWQDRKIDLSELSIAK